MARAYYRLLVYGARPMVARGVALVLGFAAVLAAPVALAQEVAPPPAAPPPPKPAEHQGSFVFGSYGRIIAASDASGHPTRDSDIVAHGSRVDLPNYVELELRREDRWPSAGADTRMVATLAVSNPIFHYTGNFDAKLAVRNLFLEERGLGTKGLSVWAGSRMLRGDDIYLLDFWPLDNLNTLGGGVRYEAPTHTIAQVHMGLGQPQNPFYRQEAQRPVALNQFGVATIDLLNRQRWIGSARLEQQIFFGHSGAGVKMVGYGEAHRLPAGQRETAQPSVYEDVSAETGFVVGAQLGAFSGAHDTHLNAFVRYARGLAAYGELAAPGQLAADHTTAGARELVVAAGGNFEYDRFAIMAGGYFRSFRNASRALDFGDVDEGILIARPQVWFVDWAGLALEGSIQVQQRGVLAPTGDGGALAPLVAKMPRVGVIPFLSPAGRGSYSRPVIWLVYSAGFRDAAARALYPVDDPFATRKVEQFIGFGAEWWFGSTSYGGGL